VIGARRGADGTAEVALTDLQGDGSVDLAQPGVPWA